MWGNEGSMERSEAEDSSLEEAGEGEKLWGPCINYHVV